MKLLSFSSVRLNLQPRQFRTVPTACTTQDLLVRVLDQFSCHTKRDTKAALQVRDAICFERSKVRPHEYKMVPSSTCGHGAVRRHHLLCPLAQGGWLKKTMVKSWKQQNIKLRLRACLYDLVGFCNKMSDVLGQATYPTTLGRSTCPSSIADLTSVAAGLR